MSNQELVARAIAKGQIKLALPGPRALSKFEMTARRLQAERRAANLAKGLTTAGTPWRRSPNKAK